MSEIIWLNGQYLDANKALIPHSDAGFQRGLGVFDTMLGIDGEPINPQPHFKRLTDNCKTCLLTDFPYDLDWFCTTASRLLDKMGLREGHARIRTQITTGTPKEMFALPDKPLIMMSAIAAHVPEEITPLKVCIVEEYPRIAHCAFENCKRIDYTRSYFAKQKAIAEGFDDAIITNTEGNVACATTSNLFILEGNKLITPPLVDGVLDGITRKTLISEGNVKEQSISKTRLLSADAIFFTNSILGIRPIMQVNQSGFNTDIPIKKVA